MILCYAWTNTQIINLANAVTHNFQGEPADLLILDLKRIDHEFVELVRRSGIFRSVLLLKPYTFPTEPNRLVAAFRVLVRPGAPMQYYRSTLHALYGEEIYDWLLTSGYFAETLYILRYFYAIHPQIRVAFVEEGMATYYRGKASLCRSSENLSYVNRCKQWLFHRGFLRRAKRMADTIYLYCPGIFHNQGWSVVKALPALSVDNPVYGPLIAPFAAWPEVAIYTKKEYYYIALPCGRNARADKRQNALIAAVCQMAGNSGVVVKLHPSNLEDCARPVVPLGADAVLDDGNYPLEAVLCHVDLAGKTVLADCSTLLMAPKCMLGKEPSVCFLYRLLEGDGNSLYDSGEKLAADLKALLPPAKISIPASFEELSVFMNHGR